jgi:hypothetical protein
MASLIQYLRSQLFVLAAPVMNKGAGGGAAPRTAKFKGRKKYAEKQLL